MENSPLVTVLTPTFNHEKYITDCIRSVRDQTYNRWEMLIIDDGSTDQTREKVLDYIADEPRVKLIAQENVGIFRLSETYNRGLSAARGKYIAILEGDDVWMPDKLERQISDLEKHTDSVLAWGKVANTEPDLSGIYKISPSDDSNTAKTFYDNLPVGNILNILYLDNCIPALTMVIRKDALDKIGGFQQGYHLPLVDLPTILQLSTIGRFCFNNHLLGKWRIYPSQTTKTLVLDVLEGRYALVKDHFSQLDTEIKNKLVISRKDIDREFKKIFQIAYARSGRYRLIRNDFKEARKDYLKAIFYPSIKYPLWKLRALTGYVLSFFRTDVERLAKLLGKRGYKE